MKREQIEKGKVILDKLESIDRAIESLTGTLNSSTGITLSSSFTAKFKDELIIWMDSVKRDLEKELEEI